MKNRNILINPISIDILLKSKNNIHLDFIDFKKVYDSINYHALFFTLKKLKFPNNFSNLLRNMIKGSSTRLIINNQLSDLIKIKCGVKQGDPLNPSLFNICINTFIKIIIKKT